MNRQELAKDLARYEIFKKVLNVHGQIIECGVHNGNGLMLWANLSAALEPFNTQRIIVGFDGFCGFPSVDSKDGGHQVGEMASQSLELLLDWVKLYDDNRPAGHIPRVCIEVGDACETIPSYLVEHPETIVALLHCDFDIYQPTKIALEHFVPRMPKGGIIVFDQLNNKSWPGETQAAIEYFNMNNLEIRRFPFTSTLSYAIIGG